MAARKEVELVIRAKNEATKAVDAISTSIKTLVAETAKVQAGAGKAQSSLGALQGALGSLTKELGGVSIGKKLAAEVDTAVAAIDRLKGRTSAVETELASLGQKSTEAAAATASLTTKTGELAAAVQREEAALAKAKAEQAALTGSLRQAAAERDRLISSEKAVGAEIEAQNKRVTEAHQKYTRLKEAVAAADEPTAKLKTSFERAGAAIDKQNAKLDELYGRQTGIKTALATATSGVSDFENRIKTANTALATQKTALEGTAAEYKATDAALRSAAANQGALERAVEKTGAELKGQKAAVDSAQSSLAELNAAAATAGAEQEKLARVVRSGLLRAFGDQRKAVAEAKADYEATKVTLHALSAEIRATEAPSAALAVAFEKTRAAARAQKEAYEAQTSVFNRMRAELRAAGSDYDALTGAVGRFSALTGSTKDVVEKTGSATEESAKAIKRLGGASGEGAAGARQLKNELEGAADASGKAGKGTGLFNESLKQLFGDGRQAMSIVSRLRAEVLALAASYAGIGAAVSGVKKMVEAYQGLEAATSRLNVAFNAGGTKAVNSELDFTRRTANRLGIEINTLSGEYSKFAIATQGTSLEGDKTRKIFLAVAEAARVQKLSLDDTKGVFLALSQMVSKGKVSMEELRQQLGDRLPGAVQLMADAVGVTVSELFKMIEAGEVSSDVLDKFADKLNEKFGGSLKASLSTLTTEMGRFQNAGTQAFIKIAESGGAAGLQNLLASLTKFFQSPDGQAFFARVGAGLKFVFDGLAALVNNIRIVGAAFAGLIAIRLAGFFVAAGTAIAALLGSLGLVSVAAPAAATAVKLVGLSAVTTTAQVTGLRLALSLLGGPVGIILGIGATLFAAWALSADKATEAMVKGKTAADALLDAADRAKKAGKTGLDFGEKYGFQNALRQKEVTDDLAKGLAQAKIQADAARDAITGASRSIFGFKEGEFELNQLTEQFKNGKLTVEEYTKQVNDLVEKTKSPALAEVALTVLKQVESFVKAKDSVDEYEARLRLAAGTATDADKKLLGLNSSVDGSKSAFERAAEAAKKYKEAVNEIKSEIPSFKKEIEELKEIEDLNNKITAAAKLKNEEYKKGDALPAELKLLKTQGEAEIRAKYAEDRYKREFEADKDTTEGQRLGELVETMSKFAQSNGVENKDLLAAFGALTNGTFKLNEAQAKAFGTDAAAPQIEQLKAVFEKLKANGLEANDGVNKITAILQSLATSIPEAIKATAEAVKAGVGGGGGATGNVDLSGVKDGQDAAARLLRKFEGFIDTAKYDVNAFRAGYGSDTVTLSDGTIQKIASVSVVNRADAERDLARRIGDFQQGIVKQIGEERFKSFDPTQQGVLTSIAYNYGSLPDRIVGAVKTGTTEEIVSAIRGLAGDNNGVNKGRRNSEASFFAGAGGGEGPSADAVARAAALEASYKERAKDGEKLAKAEEKAAERAAAGLEKENARLGIAELKAEAGKAATLEEQIALDAAKQAEAARKGGYELTAEMIERQKQLSTETYKTAEAERAAKAEKQAGVAAQKEANAQSAQAAEYARQIAALKKTEVTQNRAGDVEGAEATRAKIAELTTKMQEAAATALTMHQAIGGTAADTAAAKLEALKTKTEGLKGSMANLGLDLKQVAETLAGSATSAFDQFAQDIAAGKNVMESLRNAFLKFASDFLRQIAQMIIKQAIFNAIQSVTGNLGLGGAGGLIKHSGGIVGAVGNRTRTVSPMWFQNAQRYHGGGVAGLKSNEVPAILERNEEVLTQDDPRHIFNQGGGGPGLPPEVKLNVINALDSADMVQKGLGSGVGQKAVLNFIKDNAGAVKSALEG